MKRIVAGHDAVGGAGELDHARLIADIGGLISLIEGGARFMLGEAGLLPQTEAQTPPAS